MQLKDRDINLLTTISNLRFMTTQQIHAIHGYNGKYGENVTRRKLKELEAAGLLKSWQPDIYSSKIFYLNKAGAKEVEFYHGYKNVKTYQKSRLTLHQVMVTEVYVRLRQLTGGKIRRFAIHAKVGDIEADAFVEYQLGGGIDPLKGENYPIKIFFLEADRATETLQVITDKLNEYQKVYENGEWQKRYGIFPEVSFVTSTDARKRSLWRVLQGYPYKSKVITEKELTDNSRALVE